MLSFDSLLGSSGGVVVQPILGKAAYVWNYPGIYALALPFAWLARKAGRGPDAQKADQTRADNTILTAPKL